jgi:hypothetical protein
VDEFWDAAESYFDDPSAATAINVTAGAAVTRNIILNGTSQRLDVYEDEASVRPPFGLSSTRIFRSGR